MTNRKTHEANHNKARWPTFSRPSAKSACRLSIVSMATTRSLCSARQYIRAWNARFLRVIDLAFFIAEHDDHHLARISELKGLFA